MTSRRANRGRRRAAAQSGAYTHRQIAALCDLARGPLYRHRQRPGWSNHPARGFTSQTLRSLRDAGLATFNCTATSPAAFKPGRAEITATGRLVLTRVSGRRESPAGSRSPARGEQ